ncbi:MAG TPA: ribbon-helix-helix domain-containing protein [Azospirillaceae bacterium]|nr:ribbon-helix-helix domain-containing protein [Azospirillaceae bacterium]HRQ80169.1 ribbon-helix-helix domain-containing protein [Azospirillaceae bacterium]
MSKPRGRQRKKTPATLGVEPLQGRNVLLHGEQRTSMRLEPSMWLALEEIAKRECISINGLCSRIDQRLKEQARRKGIDPDKSEVTLTSGVRVFIFAYYRAASTESGHQAAGHGLGDPFIGTPFAKPEDEADPSPVGGEPSPEAPTRHSVSQSHEASLTVE